MSAHYHNDNSSSSYHNPTLLSEPLPEFPFLHKLDELPGRLIDNAGFMAVNDIDTIKDAELYDRLLNEFPQWLVKAREKKLI